LGPPFAEAHFSSEFFSVTFVPCSLDNPFFSLAFLALNCADHVFPLNFQLFPFPHPPVTFPRDAPTSRYLMPSSFLTRTSPFCSRLRISDSCRNNRNPQRRIFFLIINPQCSPLLSSRLEITRPLCPISETTIRRPLAQVIQEFLTVPLPITPPHHFFESSLTF